MYWTLEGVGPLPTVTLCEHHALIATNMAQAIMGEPDFGSMAEADAVTSALLALQGFDLGMTSSEIGHCGECEDEASAHALNRSESA